MPRNREHRRSDWTLGPAAWAPILLLSLLAILGAGVAVNTQRPAPGDPSALAPLPERRVNVNTAGAAQLQLLPRIGPNLAGRLIAERDANGPFENARDIQRVRGIGPRTAARIAAVADFSIPR
jgi:competence protein ComEA